MFKKRAAPSLLGASTYSIYWSSDAGSKFANCIKEQRAELQQFLQLKLLPIPY